MAPVLERICHRSLFLGMFYQEAEERKKMGLDIETITEDVQSLKVRLADLETEHSELVRMLVAGGRAP
jgi:hypothetical protein